MAKGKHAEFERIRLDEQLYLLKYADGRIKVVLQEGTLVVTEVMTRKGETTPGSHVFLSLRRNTHPKPTMTRRARAAQRQADAARNIKVGTGVDPWHPEVPT